MANGINVTGIVNEDNNSVTFTSRTQTTVFGVVSVGLKGERGEAGQVQNIISGSGITVDDSDPNNPIVSYSGNAGIGDVVGPASSTDNAITRYDGATGKLLQNTTETTIDDSGVVRFGPTEAETPYASARTRIVDNTGDLSDIALNTYGGGYATLAFMGANGTADSPSNTSSNAAIGSIVFRSRSGANSYAQRVAITSYNPGVLNVEANNDISIQSSFGDVEIYGNTVDLTGAANNVNGVPIVTTTDTQTLTNKTLTSPVINSPTGITKSDVGLSNVDNTSDANKPVSTATQTALNAKLTKAGDVMSGHLGMGFFQIYNLADATANDHAVNRGQLYSGLDTKVTGPASATDNNLVAFDSTTGKLAKDSGINATTLNNQITDLYANKQNLVTLTTTGTSGAATFNQTTGALNIPQYSGGGGGGSGITRSVSNISGTTSAGSTANTDYVYHTTGTFTLTLPTPVGNTNRYSVVNKDGGTVTVATATGTILGSSTITMATQYQSRDFISDGTNWYIL